MRWLRSKDGTESGRCLATSTELRAIGADGKLLVDVLQDLMKKPASYEPGEPLFWDDPHISAPVNPNY